jgi:hypothetical protein
MNAKQKEAKRKRIAKEQASRVIASNASVLAWQLRMANEARMKEEKELRRAVEMETADKPSLVNGDSW